jgi:hypothetical protein
MKSTIEHAEDSEYFLIPMASLKDKLAVLNTQK